MTEQPRGRAAQKPVIFKVEETPCPRRVELDGMHYLVNVEIGPEGESALATSCAFCGATWGDLDQRINPKATGRKRVAESA